MPRLALGPHAGMDEAKERALIAQCVETIRRVHGKPPVGTACKSSASVNTRRLLIEHGGFLYDSDAYNDDAPYYVQVADNRISCCRTPSIPTICVSSTYAFVRGSDFAGYVIDAFDWLWEEGARQPRMLSIGLHTRIIGRAARIGGLGQALKHMQAKGGAWFARRGHCASLAQGGAPEMKRLVINPTLRLGSLLPIRQCY